MSSYEQEALSELRRWQKKMRQPPSLLNKLSKDVQMRVNKIIPEKVHRVLLLPLNRWYKAYWQVRALLIQNLYTL